jgi:hypothetical protein
VTATLTRRVKPGHEPFYESFLEGIIAAAARFPGHLGVEVFRPGARRQASTASSIASTPASIYAPGSTPTSAPPGSNAPNRT